MFDHFGGFHFLVLMSSFDLEDVVSFQESLFSRANCQFQGGYQILICCFFDLKNPAGQKFNNCDINCSGSLS